MHENRQQVDSLFPVMTADSVDDKNRNIDNNRSSETESNQVVVMVIEDAPQGTSLVGHAKSERSSLLDVPTAVPFTSDEETISSPSVLVTEHLDTASAVENGEVVIDNVATDNVAIAGLRRSGRRRNVAYNCKEFPAASFASKTSKSSTVNVNKRSSKRRRISEMNKQS